MTRTRNRRGPVLRLGGLLATAGLAGSAGAIHHEVASAPTDHAPPHVLALVGAGIDACGDNNKIQQQGGTGSTTNKTCANSGLVFNGPSIGNVAVVLGPTVIGPVVIGDAVTAAGNAIGASPTGVGASENNGVGA